MKIGDITERRLNKKRKNPPSGLYAGKKAKQVKAKSKKPKLIKPNLGHQSEHPFQGKLVGEDVTKLYVVILIYPSVYCGFNFFMWKFV